MNCFERDICQWIPLKECVWLLTNQFSMCLICVMCNVWSTSVYCAKHYMRLFKLYSAFLKDATMQSHNCGKYFRICANLELMKANQEKLAQMYINQKGPQIPLGLKSTQVSNKQMNCVSRDRSCFPLFWLGKP